MPTFRLLSGKERALFLFVERPRFREIIPSLGGSYCKSQNWHPIHRRMFLFFFMRARPHTWMLQEIPIRTKPGDARVGDVKRLLADTLQVPHGRFSSLC